nr:hypothetical protein [Tanacetum cinerariifolium]
MALAGSTRANTVQARGCIGANTGTLDSNVISLLETMGNTTPNVEEWIRFYHKDEWAVIGVGERRDGGLLHFREELESILDANMSSAIEKMLFDDDRSIIFAKINAFLLDTEINGNEQIDGGVAAYYCLGTQKHLGRKYELCDRDMEHKGEGCVLGFIREENSSAFQVLDRDRLQVYWYNASQNVIPKPHGAARRVIMAEFAVIKGPSGPSEGKGDNPSKRDEDEAWVYDYDHREDRSDGEEDYGFD